MATRSENGVRRRQQRGGADARLAHTMNNAQSMAQAIGRSNQRRGAGRRSGDPSRLRSLLMLLLITTLLLVLLQGVRYAYPRKGGRRAGGRGSDKHAAPASVLSTSSRSLQRALEMVMANVRGDASSVPPAMPSVSAVAAQREADAEAKESPLSWQKYIAGMRKHFDEELSAKKQRPAASEERVSHSTGGVGEGMAVVPGEGVQDHEVETEPRPVAGKSQEEARQDRKVALEDIDQETLKAMFDALYGRG